MILVLASTADIEAAAFVQRWPAQCGTLLTPADLSTPHWCHVTHARGASRGAANGEPFDIDAVRGVKGSWARATRALQLLASHGLPCRLAFTAVKANYRSVAEVIDLAIALGIILLTLAFFANAAMLRLQKRIGD